jgi:hypothetical protein
MLTEELGETRSWFMKTLALAIGVLIAFLWTFIPETRTPHVSYGPLGEIEVVTANSSESLYVIPYQEAEMLLNNFCLTNTGRLCKELPLDRASLEQFIFILQLNGRLTTRPLLCIPSYGTGQSVPQKVGRST